MFINSFIDIIEIWRNDRLSAAGPVRGEESGVLFVGRDNCLI